jgi:sec-independent protein translocase protein TatC
MSDEKELTFWEHLDALRGVLFRIAAVIVVLGVAAFCVMPWIFDHVILAPCSSDFPLYTGLESLSKACGIEVMPDESSRFTVNVTSMELTSQLFIHMSASCWMAFIFGFPIIIYLLWSFISPGLYEREKQGAKRAFLFGNIMFFLGVAVGYFLVFPLAVRFLASYRLSEHINNVVSLDSYMDNFFTIILLMGAVFELPLVAWLLGKMGLIKRDFFKHYRRHAIVALLITAAMITPTSDPFTLFAVFIPIYALWEFSSRLVPPPDED